MMLTGNKLGNDGTITVLKGVSIAKELKKIYLADNQFNEDQEVLDAIKDCMTRNKNLARYDFKYNALEDIGKYFKYLSNLIFIQPLNFLPLCQDQKKKVKFLTQQNLK